MYYTKKYDNVYMIYNEFEEVIVQCDKLKEVAEYLNVSIATIIRNMNNKTLLHTSKGRFEVIKVNLKGC